MHPIKFKQYNAILAEDQPQYLPLPVCKIRDDKGTIVSCWQLTLKERFQIMFSGKFYLTVLTFGTPLQPQRPTVESPINDKV